MKKLTIIALISFVFFSCKEDDVSYPPTLGAGTVTVTKEAQTVKIPIVSEMEVLDVTMPESAKEWCSYEWSQSEIIATVEANKLIPREVTFTLKAEVRDGTATLKQEGRSLKDFKQYDMENWSIAAVSDEIPSDGGGAIAILNIKEPHSTFWHSDWSTGTPLPHWIVIDMKEERDIDMLQLGWRQNGDKYYYYNKITEAYVGNSPDPALITNKVGSLQTLATAGVSSSNTYEPYHYLGLEPSKGRYLKLVVPESNSGVNSIIAYVKVYKYEGTN